MWNTSRFYDSINRMNTLQKGTVRYMVFREEDTWYAVALEFNIVESGDDPREVLFNLFEAIQGYVLSARKAHIRAEKILNQKTDKEYETLWKKVTAPRAIKSPFQIYSYGKQLIA